MVKYAIISDIHGNLEALNAVVEDMKKQEVDRVICLGDIISKGAHSHECVQIIKDICDAVVKGNNDVHYTKSLDEIAGGCENFDYDYFYWNQKQLSSDDINFLRKLPLCCEFMLSGRLIRCFHATPQSPEISVFNFDAYDKKLKLFEPTEFTTNKTADVVIYGHTHHISYEKLFGHILINSGSVGNALNIISNEVQNNPKIADFTMAEYLIISGEDGDNLGEIGVEMRCVPYDKEKELKSLPDNKYKEKYTAEIMDGAYRNPQRINNHLRQANDKNSY